MDLQTYVNAIEKIHSDPLSFLFSSHAEKRERQLSKFHAAVEHSVQSDLANAPENVETSATSPHIKTEVAP